ncbi:chromatin modification-related protein EAF1 A-like isoform X2 [Malania oleifera]|uniref:chromatin modification-related protein EAF1 A-like isoform X2 n=1 Tax=Malania oleifera TaxID=397392 RepID=UPI0025AE72D4|nr:chromatin modification-related protein EAF1 A-like isoform X2 [Malania oleifera]
MHGCCSGPAVLVNAEVDSMGGVVDGGVGIGTKTSPRRVAIEKAQEELRQEYDVREERRRELEFLEKGGNPLDFKFGHAASVSVQSTSLPEHPELVTSEAKGSFALTASPHGDSVESSGRPGAPAVNEPNTADNLLLLDGDNESLEGERNSLHPSRSNVAPSEQSSQMEGSQNAKESEDSGIIRLVKNQAYARRNRSKSNRDGARSSSGGHGSSLSVRHGSRDPKGLRSEINNQKDQNIASTCNTKSTSPNGDIVFKTVTSDNQLDVELDTSLTKGELFEGKLNVAASNNLQDNHHNLQSKVEAQQTPIDSASAGHDLGGGREQPVSVGLECQPSAATVSTGNETCSGQLNWFNNLKRDRRSIRDEGKHSSAALSTKGLDSESSCTQTCVSLDGNNDSDLRTNPKNVDSNGNPKEQTLAFEGAPDLEGNEAVKQKNEAKTIVDVDHSSVHQNHIGNGCMVKVEDEVNGSRPDSENDARYPTNIEGMKVSDHNASKNDTISGNLLHDSDHSNLKNENSSTDRPQPEGFSMAVSCKLPLSASASEVQTSSDNCSKMANKAHEDSILEEARIIQAKRKRIAELSVGALPLEIRRKSHWDFVLEEMAWLANDFAQERTWKMTVAAQMCHSAAFASQLRFEKQGLYSKQRKVAYTLAKAVMQFWHSAELLLNSDDPSDSPEDGKFDVVGFGTLDGNEVAKDGVGVPNKVLGWAFMGIGSISALLEMNKDLEGQYTGKNLALAVQRYALRFLKDNSSSVPTVRAEAPVTPDRVTDLGTLEMSWEDHFMEESLFYKVPLGAMEAYRKSIESYVVQCEKTGSSVQEEVETSMYDAGAEFGTQELAYEEDGETSTYYLPGTVESSRLSKFAQKKRKNLTKSYTARSYELGADTPYGQCMENKIGNQPSILLAKRPASSLNVGSIPTKRMRTASRQRVLSPFSTGVPGGVLAPSKTDASSGDTNSLQDDQSTLHGGSQIQKSLEVESAVDFEKQVPFDCTEISKPKKKKKAKHLCPTYEQRWQLDSSIQHDQRDNSRKRLESHHFESNGSSGLFAQHSVKKPRIIKQSLDNSFDTPMTGSIPSPVASQMSNMSNPTKFIKMIGGRDRGKKAKLLKIPAGQSGIGSPWTAFEDQALVVLVHDMGPNWELVSDCINNTLQIKCVFRMPKECKERHKILMDRSADGVDSAEDSGSSQPYPSTLPGIPKGSARQLFQRLQGPMEEDTLKAHFEKIISIVQQQHYQKSQESKQIATGIHNSHIVALSQVCPNNLNGVTLTPLDLIDAATSNPDVLSLGYQGSHTSGLPISNQGSVASILPASGANSSLQGSSGMILGSNLSSPSAPLNGSVRDGRYGVPRASSLPVEEQQRMQQYNHMLSGRNIQQASLSVPGTDRGVRMLPGGNSMGMMCGPNRSMPMPRPGLPGIASSSMLNSGSMLSSSMMGMPSPVNIHSGASSAQGNSLLRPREALHMMRPGQNTEHQRQMMVPEIQMQVTQGNNQGVPPFSGLSSAFSNQTIPSPVQTYAVHPPQQHQMSPQQSHVLGNPHHPHLQGPNHTASTQQQAYAIRLAKERQLQQRIFQQQQQQQQQQFAASNTLMPHVQSQAQIAPISSSLQNSSPIQPQTSQSVSLPPLTSSSPMTPISSQHQQKHHLPPHGIGRSSQTGAGVLASQMGKQRQRQLQQQQQFPQAGRHHPQQRPSSQSQQQAKLLKGIGRGNMLMHQNLPMDSSHLNGLTPPTSSQAADKGEQVMQLMQGQGLYSGSGLNAAQAAKPLVAPKPQPPQQPQKLFLVVTLCQTSRTTTPPYFLIIAVKARFHQFLLVCQLSDSHHAAPLIMLPHAAHCS